MKIAGAKKDEGLKLGLDEGVKLLDFLRGGAIAQMRAPVAGVELGNIRDGVIAPGVVQVQVDLAQSSFSGSMRMLVWPAAFFSW